MARPEISRVHIVDATPLFRRGMRAAFHDAGYVTTESCEPPSSPLPDDTAAVMTVGGSSDPIEESRAGGGLRIAVVDSHSVEFLVELVRVGVDGIVDRDAEPETAVAAVRMATDGHALIPAWGLRAMALRLPAPMPASTWVTDDEIEWLRILARGSTVAGLADSIGYSERETFRLLHDLYLRIGVANRTEALMWATRHGLVTPPGRGHDRSPRS